MNTNKLALRRQSIRNLTADELRFARGGEGGNGTGGGTGTGTHTKHTTVPTTGTHTGTGQTRTVTDLPPRTARWHSQSSSRGMTPSGAIPPHNRPDSVMGRYSLRPARPKTSRKKLSPLVPPRLLPVSAAQPGPRPHNKEKPMNTNKLALRKQSIRTLTADELRIAHGGKGNGTGTGTGNGTGTGTGNGTGTRHTKTQVPPPPPPPTKLW